MADEPRYLKGNPQLPGAAAPGVGTPAGLSAATPGSPSAAGAARFADGLSPAQRRVFDDAAREAATGAANSLVEMAANFQPRRWDELARAPAVPVTEHVGGMTVTVPASWRRDGNETRALVWSVADRALVSLPALVFARRVPPLDEYAEHRARAMEGGWLRLAAPRQIAHPSGLEAMEIGECAAADVRLPLRVLRFLRHPAGIVMLKLDTNGVLPEAIGAEFAQAFASLQLR